MEKQQAELEINMIKQIIDDSKKIVVDDGKGFIIWGVLIVIGLLGTYFFIPLRLYEYISLLWIAVIGIGWVYTIIIHAVKDHKKKVKTFAGKILGALWFSCGVSMTIVGFVGTGTGSYGAYTISPLMSVILGIAYFVTGIIYGRAWVRNLAIGWWIGAIVTFIWTGMYSLLVFAVMMIALQVIPGIILYSKFKNEYQANLNG
jgi:hypothetical protein